MRTEEASSARTHRADSLEVVLLGRLVIKSRVEILSFHGRKGQELLAFLVLFRERAHHREALAEKLWGAEDHAPDPKKQLRQALWQLRLAVQTKPRGRPVLLVEDEWLQVNPQAGIWADVWELEEGFSVTKGLPGNALNQEHVQRLRRGVDLYRADLLEGWYRDWCVYERERLRTIYLSTLDKLLAYCEGHGLVEEGLTYGERILAQDRAHERTHWRMMRLHLLGGDRTRALRQFDHCAMALKEELGIEPSGPTIVLLDEIRRGTVLAQTE